MAQLASGDNACCYRHVLCDIIKKRYSAASRRKMPNVLSSHWTILQYLCFQCVFCIQVFRAQEPKAPVTYCDHALSGVRPSPVRRPLNYLHFQLLLQNRLMDFDETWYGWSTQGPLQVLLFFGQIRPGVDPGRGQNRSQGVPFFKKLLLQSGRLQQQTDCIAVI